DTVAWIETGPWVSTEDELMRTRRGRAIERYAADLLSRRRKQIKKKGRVLRQLNPERRHKLRIQMKKMRYSIEFFSSLFQEHKARKQCKKMRAALKRLQDSMGGLNDVARRKALCAEFISGRSRGSGKNSGRDRAFAAGLITGDQQARSSELLA